MGNWFRKFTSITANICQIIIVILAIIEYNIHIKPTFQNQLLSEENARLIIENKKIKDNSEQIQNITNSLILTKQQELETLQIKLQETNNQLEKTSEKLKVIEIEQREQKEAEKIKKEKENIVNSITNFKKLIEEKCGESRTNKIFKETIKEFGLLANKDEVDKDKYLHKYPFHNIDKFIDVFFYNPYIKIYNSLDSIQAENLNNSDKQLNEYISDFKKILVEKEKYIIFDTNKVLNLRNYLIEHKSQILNLEKKMDNSKSYSQWEQLFKEKTEIEKVADKMIQNLENEIIDYKDIINPVINEMLNNYLERYN